jgi:hypothetical protein
VGQGLLVVDASLSHSDTPQSVGFLWTRDQPDAERPLPDNTRHKGQPYMPAAGFELAIPASERLQTHALDRAASEIGAKQNH